MNSIFEHSLGTSEEYETQLAAQDQPRDRRSNIFERAVTNTTSGFKSVARRMSSAGLLRKSRELNAAVSENLDNNSSDRGENHEPMSLAEFLNSPRASISPENDYGEVPSSQVPAPSSISQPSSTCGSTQAHVSSRYSESAADTQPGAAHIQQDSTAPFLPEIPRGKSLREELGHFQHRGEPSCTCLNIPDHITSSHSEEESLHFKKAQRQQDGRVASTNGGQSQQQVVMSKEHATSHPRPSLGSSGEDRLAQRSKAQRCVLTPFHKL